MEETASLTGVSKGEIKEVMNFYTAFAADTMKAGLFEGVSFPHFGKIQPKVHKIQLAPEYLGRVKTEKNTLT